MNVCVCVVVWRQGTLDVLAIYATFLLLPLSLTAHGARLWSFTSILRGTAVLYSTKQTMKNNRKYWFHSWPYSNMILSHRLFYLCWGSVEILKPQCCAFNINICRGRYFEHRLVSAASLILTNSVSKET